MPWAFYIFISGLVGGLFLLGIHIFELKRGEIELLEKLRDSSDTFFLKLIKLGMKKQRILVQEARKRAPNVFRKAIRLLRKENLRKNLKQLVGYIAQGIHDGIVYILKFFGKMRKYVEKMAEKNLK